MSVAPSLSLPPGRTVPKPPFCPLGPLMLPPPKVSQGTNVDLCSAKQINRMLAMWGRLCGLLPELQLLNPGSEKGARQKY